MNKIDWKASFSAFDGPAKLDASYMVKAKVTDPTTNVTKDDTEADCQKFYDWIEHLREDLMSTNHDPGSTTGIQPDFVGDARELINEFFPIRDENNKWTPAVRIKTKNQGNTADPKIVRIGNKNPLGRLQILDAASALGYIFTVAKHPQDATWQNYYLPLNLLYCRFLYLAFVKGRLPDSSIVDTAVDVPQTSCVMYAGAGEPIRYYYGSSPARIYTPVGESQALRNNSIQTVDTYRLENVLKPNLQLTDANKRIPRYSPKTLEDLVSAFWTALTRSSQTKIAILDHEKDPLKTLLPTVSEEMTIAYEGAFKPQKFDTLPLAKIRGHSQLGPQLGQPLSTLVAARFLPPNGNYDKDKPETLAAWQELLAIYLVPQMVHQVKPKDWSQGIFDVPDTPISKPVKSAITAAKAKVIGAFWGPYKDKLQQVLEDVYVAAQSQHPRNPFGRCAETYCVVSTLPLFNNPAPMNTVRGMALAVTPIGNSDAFSTAFDTVALGKASSSEPRRQPCVNCKELLPLYGIVLGKQSYDKDLFDIPNQVGDPN